jgi:hypothetical protein
VQLTSPTPPCLSCRARSPQCRGLFVPCYNRLAVSVRHAETTWAALEAAGQALPAKRSGRHYPPKEGR